MATLQELQAETDARRGMSHGTSKPSSRPLITALERLKRGEAMLTGRPMVDSLREQFGTESGQLDTALDMVSPMGGMAGILGKVGKQPWKMTQSEYDTSSILKKNELLTVGDSRVSVIQNPTDAQRASMKSDALKKYGKPGNNDPVIRFTEDADGNNYIWPAYEAIHAQIEPSLMRITGTTLNQNAAQKLSHRGMVRKALYDGEDVPAAIYSEYPGLLDEVKNIPFNKVRTSNYVVFPGNEDILTILQRNSQDMAK